MQRDPRDRRYIERLAGSSLASLLIHVLLALSLFTVSISTAQEGASENVQGGSLVTLEQQRAPVVARVPAQPENAAPVPHASTAPVVTHARAAQPAHQPLPPRHRELSKFAPTAPPNPTPLPQASVEPNVQPTVAVYEPNPSNELPAVPTSVPTASAVAVMAKLPPTAAPSPVPTVAPTARPTPLPPAPTAVPSAKPQTPAPAATVAATSKPAQPAASAAASASPSTTVARSSAPPAPKAGAASPSPTKGPALASTTGTNPSPGPKGNASPGPHAGSGAQHEAPQRPVHVQEQPTPKPQPPAKQSSAPDISAKLRNLLPHNDVNPNEGSIHSPITVGNTEPSPPPEVLALTKFIFEERGAGDDAKLKMWVTNVRHVGLALYCDGWLVRYPRSSQPPENIGTMSNPVSGGIVIGTRGPPGGFGPPIVEAHSSTLCSERQLQPFAPSSPSSP